MDSGGIPAEVFLFFKDWRAKKASLSILVIGDRGSGKTTLVNNLLGEDIAQDKSPSTLSMSKGGFQSIPVSVYETSGLESAHSEGELEYKNKMHMRSLLRPGEVELIIYCFKGTETRMRESLIKSLQSYHNMGLDWRKTVIAMTFDDVISVLKSARNDPSYDQARYFNSRVAEWKQTISQTLTTRICVPIGMVDGLKLAPATGDIEDELPNHEHWYGTVWSLVIDAIKTVPSSSASLPDQTRPSRLHTGSAVQPTTNRAGARSLGAQPSRQQGPKSSSGHEGFGSRDGLLAPSSQRENQPSCIECPCSCFKDAVVTIGSCIVACFRVCINSCTNVCQACRRSCNS